MLSRDELVKLKEIKEINIKKFLTPLRIDILKQFDKSNILTTQNLCNKFPLRHKKLFKNLLWLKKNEFVQSKKRGIYCLTNSGKELIRFIKILDIKKKSFEKLFGFIDIKNFLHSEGTVIIAALLSDGSVSGNEIKFFTVDKALNEFVWNSLQRIFNVKINKKKGSFRSKLIAEFLRLFTKTFRTIPFRKNGKIVDWTKPKIPYFIFNGNKVLKKLFFKVYFSCDGGVLLGIVWRKGAKTFSIQPQITLACKNPYLKSQLIALLENLGFNPILNDYAHLCLLGQDIIKFKKEIGFVNGSSAVHSPFWKDTAKNDLVNLAILINNLGQDIIPPNLRKDKTKREIIKQYLKSQINKIESKGLTNLEKELKIIKRKNKWLRNISNNEKIILKLLSNSNISLLQIKKNHNIKVKNVNSLLTRMKNENLIDNKFRKFWKVTNFGRKTYEKLNKYI